MDRRSFLAMGGVAAVTGATRRGGARDRVSARTPRGWHGRSDRQAADAAHPVDRAKRFPPSGSAPRAPSKSARTKPRARRCARCCKAFSRPAPRSSTPRPCIPRPKPCSAICSRPSSRRRFSSPPRCGRPDRAAHGEQKGIEQMQRSMALLKHQRIELMQVHNLVDLDAHLKTLRRWKAEGKIKYIGVTHYTTSSYPDLISIIEREKLDFVQFNYSVATREAEKRLLPLCADKGVAVHHQSRLRGRQSVHARCRASRCRPGPRSSARRAGRRCSSSSCWRIPPSPA